jgi:hypothetical protein
VWIENVPQRHKNKPNDKPGRPLEFDHGADRVVHEVLQVLSKHKVVVQLRAHSIPVCLVGPVSNPLDLVFDEGVSNAVKLYRRSCLVVTSVVRACVCARARARVCVCVRMCVCVCVRAVRDESEISETYLRFQ